MSLSDVRMTGGKLRAITLTMVMVLSVMTTGLVLSGTAAANHADEDVLTVDGDGSASGHFATIQDAVNNASNGDTIEVRPGNYNEDVLIDKPLTLVAPSGATINGQGDGKGALAAVGGTDDVTIRGFTVHQQTSGQAFNVETAGGLNENITIEENRFVAADGGFAAFVGPSRNVLFRNNEFDVASGAATELVFVGGHRTYDTTASNISLIGNTFAGAAERPSQSDGGNALEFEANNSLLQNNDFRTNVDKGVMVRTYGFNNTPSGNKGVAAIRGEQGFGYDGPLSAHEHATEGDTILVTPGTYAGGEITKSVTIQGAGPSTVIDSGFKLTGPIDGITIRGLTLRGERAASRTLYGVNTVANVTIRNVVFEGQDSVGFAVYGNDFAGDFNLTDSEIAGYNDGSSFGTVYVSTKTGLDDVEFVSNNVTDNTGMVTFHGNEQVSDSNISSLTIADNTFAEVSQDSGGLSPAALSIEDTTTTTVEGNTFRDNFAHLHHANTSLTFSDVSNNTFEKATTVFNGPEWEGLVEDSIQDSHDVATDGDRVIVAPGEYSSVDVSKNVSLIGAGPSSTLIDGGADNAILLTGHTDELSGIAITGFTLESADASGLIAFSDGNTDFDTRDLQLSNLVVNGTEFGIYLFDAKDVSLSNSVVRGVNHSAVSMAGVENVTIRGNDLVNSGTGIGLGEGNPESVYPPNGNITISDNRLLSNVVQVNDTSDTLDMPAVAGSNVFDRGVSVDAFDPATIFGTIQGAVDMADPSDVVTVGPGTYPETVHVDEEGVTLRAFGGSDPVIDGYVSVDNSSVTVTGFTIAPSTTYTVDVWDGQMQEPGNPFGVRVGGSGNHSRIVGNTIEIRGDSTGGNGSDRTFQGKTYPIGVMGVQLFGGNEIGNITVSDNRIVADMDGPADVGAGAVGIRVQGKTADVRVLRNNVTATSTGYAFGVTGPTVGHTGQGAVGPGEATLVRGNTLSASTENDIEDLYGVAVWSVNDEVLVTHNVLHDSEVGVENTGTDAVNATHNYWGHPSGPRGPGSDAVGNVTFKPYYIDADLTRLVAPGSANSASVQNDRASVSLSATNTTVEVELPNSSNASTVSVVQADAPTGGAENASENAVYLDISTDQDVTQSVTVSVTIEVSRLTAQGITPAQATLQHYNDTAGEWVELDTDVDIQGGTATLTATADGLSPFAVTERSAQSTGGGVSIGGGGGGGADQAQMTTETPTPTPAPTPTPTPTATPEPTPTATAEPPATDQPPATTEEPVQEPGGFDLSTIVLIALGLVVLIAAAAIARRRLR